MLPPRYFVNFGLCRVNSNDLRCVSFYSASLRPFIFVRSVATTPLSLASFSLEDPLFTKNVQVMLYVKDVHAEKDFWRAAGFRIVSDGEVMGYPTFTMTPGMIPGAPGANLAAVGANPAATPGEREPVEESHANAQPQASDDGGVSFVVYSLDFVKKLSPEVAHMKPSVLFEATDLHGLHERLSALTDSVSPIVEEPFESFSFQSPSGLNFAVRGV